jgi:hypothetical protein
MRETPQGANFSHLLSDFIRMLDAGSNRAITSAIPGINPKDDPYASFLDVVGGEEGM